MKSIFRRFTTAKQPLVNPIPFLPRLECHYYDTLYEDLAILNYDHSVEVPDSEWDLPDLSIEELYSMPFERLPTRPETEVCTNLLSTKYAHVGLPKKDSGFVRKLKNPIDYTTIPNEEFLAPPDEPEFPKFTPLPQRMPALRRIDLKIWAEEAAGNKNILLSAIMSLQSISGLRANPLFATRGDATKKIRAGMPLGASVSLQGQHMFNFLDKMIQCVLPRIREWKGINPVGNGKGAISFKLPASAVGTFPDIEPHFDSFPRLFDVEVTLYTSGKNDRETCMLLSGFQLPFLPEPNIDVAEAKKSDDPWAAIKNAKTREERKALFAQITAARKKPKAE